MPNSFYVGNDTYILARQEVLKLMPDCNVVDASIINTHMETLLICWKDDIY